MMIIEFLFFPSEHFYFCFLSPPTNYFLISPLNFPPSRPFVSRSFVMLSDGLTIRMFTEATGNAFVVMRDPDQNRAGALTIT